MDFMREVGFGIVVLVVVFVAIVVGIVAITQQNACQSYAEMGIPVQYDFWTGCMANHPKFGWLPVEDYFRTMNLNIPE